MPSNTPKLCPGAWKVCWLESDTRARQVFKSAQWAFTRQVDVRDTSFEVRHNNFTVCAGVACSASAGRLQFHRSRSMHHVMPIVTPRLVLRPPELLAI